MRVLIKETVPLEHQVLNAGVVVDLPEAQAQDLVDAGKAVVAGGKKAGGKKASSGPAGEG